jgi:hypothetical protein
MAAASSEPCDGDFQQWPARRRNTGGHADNPARAAACRRFLAGRACPLGRSAPPGCNANARTCTRTQPSGIHSISVARLAELANGSVNAVYFGTNAFVPPYLSDAGRTDLIGPVLTALNFGQLPASFALIAISRLLERRAWPFVCCGMLLIVCIIGIVSTASFWTVLFAGCFGFVLATLLMLCSLCPPC